MKLSGEEGKDVCPENFPWCKRFQGLKWARRGGGRRKNASLPLGPLAYLHRSSNRVIVVVSVRY